MREDAMPATADLREHPPDLIVIGLGRSGGAALEVARASHLDAIGVERNAASPDGGIPGSQHITRVWGVFPDGTVACSSAEGTTLLSPRAVIIATGAIDIPLPVPGWHLPGATGAWRAVRTLAEGTSVVVLRGPHAGSGHCAPDLSRLSILRDERLADGRSVEILGEESVERVRIGDDTFETNCVLLDNGLQTENALARMSGIPTLFAPSHGGDVITPGRIFAVGGTLISVIGDAAGVGCNPEVAIEEATATARILVESLSGGSIPPSIPSPRPEWDQSGIPRLPVQATPQTLVCPDEGATIGQVLEAIEHGAMSVNDVKRRTRAAMATCQGRDCLWTIRALLAEHERDFASPMTARPPVTGITLSDLAALSQG